MARFSLHKLPEQKRVQMLAEFYDAISSLKGREEVRSFFRDLLTPDEIAMLMRRIEVAILLQSGFTYEQIGSLLGVGRDTITNVQHSLHRHGNGYKIVVERLLKLRKGRVKKRRKQEKIGSSTFEYLKNKYPFGLLLLNLIDELSDVPDTEEDKAITSKAALHTPSAKYPI